MTSRFLTLIALLVVVPALAEDVPFNGRTLQVADAQEGGAITRMIGTQYTIPGIPDQIVARAGTCAAGVEELTVAPVDPGSVTLVAHVATSYRVAFANRTIRSRLDFNAADNTFMIVESEITTSDGGTSGFSALTRDDSGWEKGLDALVSVENKLVDCLYR